MDGVQEGAAIPPGLEEKYGDIAKAGLPRRETSTMDNFRLSTPTVFCIFASVNILAAAYAPIQDCDEVFNYWEPTHYLNHGFGLQTWEYSPEYAIRSWLFALIHAIPGKLPFLWMPERRAEFYLVRVILACACAACETRLFSVISQSLNPRIAVNFLVAMASSSGMFYASVAYLPSSFAMYTTMMGTAAFIDRYGVLKINLGIAWFALGATVGWPFSAALVLPLFIDAFLFAWMFGKVKSVAYQIWGGIFETLVIVFLQVVVDSFFYRKLIFVPWAIVSYNIFSGSSRGPDIFGTEPWHFYMRNLLLNFNIWFLLALCAGPILALMLVWRYLTRQQYSLLLPYWRSTVFVTPFYMWLAIFSMQAHKEERFMYPAYPLLCFNAAVAMHLIMYLIGQWRPARILGNISAKTTDRMIVAGVLLAVTLGLLRTAATVSAYSAPLKVYEPLQDRRYAHVGGSLCLGKEWYRFPSSYFLPKNMRARFIKSAFDGLLPGQFSESWAAPGVRPTWLVPSGMNDQNLEDPEKYIEIGQCSFLVDSYFPGSEPSSLEPNYILDTDTWEELQCSKFLDATHTSALARIIWIPDWNVIPARYRRKWGRYCLLQRKATTG